jgi:hypothetical protein
MVVNDVDGSKACPSLLHTSVIISSLPACLNWHVSRDNAFSPIAAKKQGNS